MKPRPGLKMNRELDSTPYKKFKAVQSPGGSRGVDWVACHPPP